MRKVARLPVLVAAALFATASGCARGSGMPLATGPLRGDSSLTLRPGDVIKVQVWQHEELSGEFPVDENFDLQYPLLGALDVRDMSVSALRERFRDELGRMFTNPHVAVIPLFRVAILGEVNRPGLYSVDPTLTVFDLVALAGGPTRLANQRDLRLVRGGELYPLTLTAGSIARSTLRDLGVRSGDQLLVARTRFTRDDWLVALQIANLTIAIVVLLATR